ncbi:unnamed protein product [Adineta steineri]|uniref:CUB domain-containing protein n=1 Tax=Adineta steineri TaxID=433720 RepID=A0A815PG00_9BILA|nr:unnamed protein product [Adineta steineri]CAF3714025.1 unnamed protein product [Adineta steineri]
MKIIILILICIIPSILSIPFDNLNIYSHNDCWTNENNTIMKKHAVLISFSPKFDNESESCSIHISNPWSSDMQNGFGVFLLRQMDCSSTVTIECLPGSSLLKQTAPPAIQYTCHTNSSEIQMACSIISLTYKQNMNKQEMKYSTNIQVTALAKEPCMDREILFQCPLDYPHSCIDRQLECNGRIECPNGEDERHCYPIPSSVSISIGTILLLIFGLLSMFCVVSIVLICCCCRATCHAIIRRFHPTKKDKLFQKNKMAAVVGEDAGLMRDLTTPNVIKILPQQHTEPTSLMIDSTKPVYPYMLSIIYIFSILFLSSTLAKITYFNLENTYGPYCNAQNTFTLDAGVVRYAGTPWVGKCELNLQSCCLPTLNNASLMANLSVSTRFYIYLHNPPTCLTENVIIESETGETTIIDCNATNGTEYYINTERLTVIYYRLEKFPISKFSMVVTPLKIKTRMYTPCGFDCFTDTYCIDRSLVCDRFRNCPNDIDEAHCEYSQHRPPLSFHGKIALLIVLSMIISVDISSILICYFCCGISNRNRLNSKDRKQLIINVEEGGAPPPITPLLQSEMSKDNN